MRDPLREAVKADFYPFAEQQGFVRLRRNGSSNVTFRRQRAEIVDVFEIHWDTERKPMFVLNLGQFEAARAERKGIDPMNCEKPVRLQRGRGGSQRAWFRLDKSLAEALRTRSLHYAPDDVVAQLKAQFAQAEAWWMTKAEGPDLAAVGAAASVR